MKIALIAIIVGFFVSLILSPLIIKIIKMLKSEQNVLEYVENHKEKNGTLTLGGLIFIISSGITFFIFNKSNSIMGIVAYAVSVSYGLLGFLDDFIKIKCKRNMGLRAYQKALGQIGIALIIAIFAYRFNLIGSDILIPFTNVKFDIGFWIIPFIVIFYLAVTNSVNLTDGLDGLAGGVSFVVIFSFIPIISMLITNFENVGESSVLIDEYKNLMILCGAMCGGLLTFLILNSNPAKIFMGDTGSLALGGLIASILTFTREYFLIFVVGFVFVATVFSSALQVVWYKITKKRVFKMAPLHHHFELCGFKETKIVSAYIIVTIILNVLSVVLFMGVWVWIIIKMFWFTVTGRVEKVSKNC